MTDEAALAKANEIAGEHGLVASYLDEHGEVRTVGVQGDERVYTRAVVLKGPYPGNDVLGRVSTQITNQTPMCRVLFDITGIKLSS